MSIEELDRIIPVNPPIVNRKINPRVQINAGFIFSKEPLRLANQLKILIPVGIAIIIVIEV
jgi:hypothetical protein